jgi:hypothetical protein
MHGCFGIVGADKLWAWQHERHYSPLQDQRIDCAADGNKDAQQDKQFFHGTSIA